MSMEPTDPTAGPHLSLVTGGSGSGKTTFLAMTAAHAAARGAIATDEAVQRADSVAGVAETYTRMADELAAMVEAEAERSARTYAVLAEALGELHDALDELGVRGVK